MEYTMRTKDRKEFMQYYNGPALYYSIWEFQSFLRSKRKYGDDPEAWEEAEKEFNEILTDNGINMEDDW